jgi:hypothetical protein
VILQLDFSKNSKTDKKCNKSTPRHVKSLVKKPLLSLRQHSFTKTLFTQAKGWCFWECLMRKMYVLGLVLVSLSACFSLAKNGFGSAKRLAVTWEA